MKRSWTLILLFLLMGGLSTLGCNSSSSSSTGGGDGGGGTPPSGKSPPSIEVGKNDVELTDPASNMDGIAAPGEVVSFEVVLHNTGDFDGKVDVPDLVVIPQGALEILTRTQDGKPVAAFTGVNVPIQGQTVLGGTARVSAVSTPPFTIKLGPPQVVPSSPPTDPETQVDPDKIVGFGTLKIEDSGGPPPPPPEEGPPHRRRPGSLLLFPFYRVTEVPGGGEYEDTLITVTNTCSDLTPGQGGLPLGTIDLKFYYLDAGTCHPFDRTERLTPSDTFSVMVGNHLPPTNKGDGWLYVVATDPTTGEAVDFDHLVGHATFFSSLDSTWFEYNALAFRALTGEGAPTDVDQDDHQDLNGVEYEMTAANQMFPRFSGGFDLPGGAFRSELLVLNLTGGAMFESSIQFLVYNDNEQVWSTSMDFKCWTLRPLEKISKVFSNAFLLSSSHDPEEELNMLGNPHVETGWFRMNGDVAWNFTKQIDDPAFVAVLLEWYNNRVVSAVPFDDGKTQANATLWPLNPLGDNED